jgi:FkbM family methyltransferase
MRTRTVAGLLWFYDRMAKGGLLDRPLPRRTFESVYLAYKHLIEAGPVARLQPVVAPGSTVIDVGANIGFFTLRFGRWVQPGGQVIAIEPESRNMATLRRRVKRAHLQHVVDCVQAVAADRPGQLRLAVNPGHPGDHRIADAGEPVRAVTIDELIAGDPRRVTLVKVDVQGAEMLVLAGAQGVIERHRPAMFVEIADWALERFGSSSGSELIEALADLGYAGHLLTRRGIGVAEAPEALTAKSAKGYIDVLFLPEARRESVSAAGTRADR